MRRLTTASTMASTSSGRWPRFGLSTTLLLPRNVAAARRRAAARRHYYRGSRAVKTRRRRFPARVGSTRAGTLSPPPRLRRRRLRSSPWPPASTSSCPGLAMVGRALPVHARGDDNGPIGRGVAVAEPGDVLVVDGARPRARSPSWAASGPARARAGRRRHRGRRLACATSTSSSSWACRSTPSAATRCRRRRSTCATPWRRRLRRLQVHRGDVVTGDRDGVVVVAAADWERVAAAGARGQRAGGGDRPRHRRAAGLTRPRGRVGRPLDASTRTMTPCDERREPGGSREPAVRLPQGRLPRQPPPGAGARGPRAHARRGRGRLRPRGPRAGAAAPRAARATAAAPVAERARELVESAPVPVPAVLRLRRRAALSGTGAPHTRVAGRRLGPQRGLPLGAAHEPLVVDHVALARAPSSRSCGSAGRSPRRSRRRRFMPGSSSASTSVSRPRACVRSSSVRRSASSMPRPSASPAGGVDRWRRRQRVSLQVPPCGRSCGRPRLAVDAAARRAVDRAGGPSSA